jgi:hypothetical protein
MPPAPSQVAIRGSANGRSLPHRCTSTSTPTAAHEKLHRCHDVAKAKPHVTRSSLQPGSAADRPRQTHSCQADGQYRR